jgi:hypothetical protein
VPGQQRVEHVCRLLSAIDRHGVRRMLTPFDHQARTASYDGRNAMSTDPVAPAAPPERFDLLSADRGDVVEVDHGARPGDPAPQRSMR